MAKLTALDPKTQADLKLSANAPLIYAQDRHMMALNVAELAHAGISFPLFISRANDSGDLSLSALTSFEADRNLFALGMAWDSTFRPAAMQNYPFYLMRPTTEGGAPGLGFDGDSKALSEDTGEPLFNANAAPAIWVSRARAQLLEVAKNTVHTFEFLKTVDALGLIRAVDISVIGDNGDVNKITGLHMINEDALQKLPSDKLTELRDRGYLAPLYAMLFSALQLNALIKRHNAVEGLNPIARINLEVAKTERAL